MEKKENEEEVDIILVLLTAPLFLNEVGETTITLEDELSEEKVEVELGGVDVDVEDTICEGTEKDVGVEKGRICEDTWKDAGVEDIIKLEDKNPKDETNRDDDSNCTRSEIRADGEGAIRLERVEVDISSGSNILSSPLPLLLLSWDNTMLTPVKK